MSRRVEIRRETWPLAQAFAISRGAKTAAEVVVCEIEQDGRVGRGECVPYARYGESLDSVEDALLVESVRMMRGRSREALLADLKPGAARNAADCALWDLEAKLSGRRVWEIAGLPEPTPCVTAFTISLGSPDAMGAAAAVAKDRPLLKLKLGADDPVARVAAVRAAAPAARLIADANEGWSMDQLAAIAPELARLGVELIEQPLPASDDGALDGYDCPVALCADESFHGPDGLPVLAKRYRAVNLKLDKTGGLTAAIEAARAAQAAGLKLMVGCMVGTSLAMAPAALLAPFADWVDLDGPLWMKADREDGLRFDGSLMHPPASALWG